MFAIRAAEKKDCKRLAEIYYPYVKNTAVTFFTLLPTEETFIHKLGEAYPQYPFLVIEEDGVIAGYAYGSAFRPHNAYLWDVELSIYLDPTYQGQGLGKILYQKLFDVLARQGFHNLYALITLPNEKSLALHEHFGFTQSGLFKKTGYKLGAWRDVIMLEKSLNNSLDEPELPLPFEQSMLS